jgi:hypothetical protein
MRGKPISLPTGIQLFCEWGRLQLIVYEFPTSSEGVVQCEHRHHGARLAAVTLSSRFDVLQCLHLAPWIRRIFRHDN